MPLFKYTAVSNKGELINSTYAGGDQSQVLQILREKQYQPVRIEELNDKRDVKELKILIQKVTYKDLAVYCRQFYTMLNAGVTIIKALDILQQHTENKRLKEITRDIYKTVQKGRTLSEALKDYRDVFPELFIHMVEAGEVSGKLDSIMDRMASHFEKENKIRSKVKSAMIYPIVLAVISVVIVVFLLTFIMPMFFKMFEDSGVALPLPTRMLLGLSKAIRGYWYILLPGILAVVYVIRKYFKTDKGRFEWDRFKLRLPVIGKTVTKIITSRFTRTLSTLLSSGMPLLQAMEVVARVAGNRVAAKGIMEVREEMRRGMDLAGPIRRTGLFPPMVDSMIRIGEESGTMDELLEKTAAFYDDEVEAALQKMVSLMEPLMILIMGAVVGFIVISIALPLFSMVDMVESM